MASHRLGNIYEAVGDPQVAKMYHKVNISLAIARSHNTLQSYSLAILHNTPRLTASLVEWKDYRDDGFIMASRPATRADSTVSGSATPTIGKEGGEPACTPTKEQ
eukprot:sb/3478022/